MEKRATKTKIGLKAHDLLTIYSKKKKIKKNGTEPQDARVSGS